MEKEEESTVSVNLLFPVGPFVWPGVALPEGGQMFDGPDCSTGAELSLINAPVLGPVAGSMTTIGPIGP